MVPPACSPLITMICLSRDVDYVRTSAPAARAVRPARDRDRHNTPNGGANGASDESEAFK